MSDHDNELDSLLAPLRNTVPDELQMKRWQAAVGRQAKAGTYRVSKARMMAQLVAAAFLGVLLGAALMKGLGKEFPSNNLVGINSESNATFERSNTNLD